MLIISELSIWIRVFPYKLLLYSCDKIDVLNMEMIFSPCRICNQFLLEFNQREIIDVKESNILYGKN